MNTYQYAINGEHFKIHADGFHYEDDGERVAVFWELFISQEADRRDVLRVEVDVRSVVKLPN